MLKRDFKITLPRWLWEEFAGLVQVEAEKIGGEVAPSKIFSLFEETYLTTPSKWRISLYSIEKKEGAIRAWIRIGEMRPIDLEGEGTGIVEALMDGLFRIFSIRATVVNFDEQAMEEGTDAKAAAFVQIRFQGKKTLISAASLGRDTTEAVLQAVLSAVAKGIG